MARTFNDIAGIYALLAARKWRLFAARDKQR